MGGAANALFLFSLAVGVSAGIQYFYPLSQTGFLSYSVVLIQLGLFVAFWGASFAPPLLLSPNGSHNLVFAQSSALFFLLFLIFSSLQLADAIQTHLYYRQLEPAYLAKAVFDGFAVFGAFIGWIAGSVRAFRLRNVLQEVHGPSTPLGASSLLVLLFTVAGGALLVGGQLSVPVQWAPVLRVYEVEAGLSAAILALCPYLAPVLQLLSQGTRSPLSTSERAALFLAGLGGSLGFLLAAAGSIIQLIVGAVNGGTAVALPVGLTVGGLVSLTIGSTVHDIMTRGQRTHVHHHRRHH